MNTKDRLHELWNEAFSIVSIPYCLTANEIEEKKKLLKEILSYMTPCSLFRYRPFNDLNIDAFENDRLYISTANYYDDKNDSFIVVDKEKLFNDIQYAFDHFDEFIEYAFSNDYSSVVDDNLRDFLISIVSNSSKESILKSKDILKARLGEFLKTNSSEHISEKYRSYAHSICFCEEGNDQYMLKEYANNGHGFVLEYEIKDFKDVLCLKNVELLPVAYTEYAFNATNYYMSLLLNIASNGILGFTNDTDILSSLKIQLTKEARYSKEHEWRLLFLNPPEDKHIRIRPKSIRLGINLSDDERIVLKRIAKEKELEIKE